MPHGKPLHSSPLTCRPLGVQGHRWAALSSWGGGPGGSRYKDMTAQGEDKLGGELLLHTASGWKAGGGVVCGDQVTSLHTCPGSSLVTEACLAWRDGGGSTLQGNTLLLPP